MRSTLILVSCLWTACSPTIQASAEVAPASAPASAPVIEASAQPASAPAPRYEGKLWTLCDTLDPAKGFCLSVAQTREIWLRFHEDRATHRKTAVDATEAAEKATALAEAAEAKQKASTFRAVLIGVGAAILGIAVGVGVDRASLLLAPR